ncbi:MAG: EVE domain-containing protein [Alphaproteobacteria bacterium]
MNYWLLKSEPGVWSWDDQTKVRKEPWDGVRNYQARNHLKAMQKGDHAFFYHSVNEKQIVGIVEVVKEYYPDPTDPSGRFGMVDVAAVKPLKRPVTLDEIKKDPKLKSLPLIRQSRLSVMPIDKASWKWICAIAEAKS